MSAKSIYLVVAERLDGPRHVLAAFESSEDAEVFIEERIDSGEYGYDWDQDGEWGPEGEWWSSEGWGFDTQEVTLHAKGARRRKNPKGDYTRGESALASTGGALVGSILGGLVGGPGLSRLGSLGGAYYGATQIYPEGRKRGARMGAGIGGVFGPLGALIGSFIGTRKTDKMRQVTNLPISAQAEFEKAFTDARMAHAELELAEDRGDKAAAKKWKKKYDKAIEGLRRLEAEHGVTDSNPSRRRSSARKLMR